MFRRKLTALDYQLADKFDVTDQSHVRNLVVWLEDQKIRHYKIEDRKALREIHSPNWPQAFRQYLNDVACPLPTKDVSQPQVLEWLLGLAVRLDYGDNVEKITKELSTNAPKNQMNAPKVVAANVLDNLDFDSPDFKSGVNALAQLLGVTKHPDHLITLQAVARLVKTRLSKEALQNPELFLVEGKPFPFQDADLGFDTGDYVMNQAAKILRLLYIHDLRELQTRINECVVAVQSVTANPKTDTRLGKVGK